MKFFKLLCILTIFIPILIACSAQNSVLYLDSEGITRITDDPQADCVLYRLIPHAKEIRTSLFFANDVALRKKIYTPDQALEVADQMQAAVDDPLATVGSVATSWLLTVAKAKKIGAPELFIISSEFDQYKDSAEPLDDCSRYRLSKFINSQKQLIMMFKP